MIRPNATNSNVPLEPLVPPVPIARALALITLTSILTACASAPGTILQRTPTSPTWPPPPDAARIAYLGELRKDTDLKPGRSALTRLGEGLFGAEPPKQMQAPIAVCTDGDDRVFVADTNARLIHVFDLAARSYATWQPDGGFIAPVAMAYDPAGFLLVSDSAAGSIAEFNNQGKLTRRIGDDALARPCGIALTPNGRLIVADVSAHQIVVLDRDGAQLSRIGRRGTGLGEFNFPTNVALDAQGRLFVSDSLNFRVQVFSPDLLPERQIGSQGDLPGYFAQPKGVAVDSRGHVFVVDANFEAVQLFTTEGQLLMSFGREGHGPGEFWLPAGIHIDSKGRIWIADSYNQRVQAFMAVTEEVEP